MFTSLRKIILSSLCVLSLFFVLSCDPKRFFEENKRIEKGVWNRKDKVIFNVMIADIRPSYDFYLDLRNGGNYPYSNIFFFIKTVFPDGRISRDTIECQLADYDGKWLGSGISDIKFNRFLFQKGVKFLQEGPYVFEVEQAMRADELNGIFDIGIRLEKQ
jgi:gliding motility-associated lipoprotein GldH